MYSMDAYYNTVWLSDFESVKSCGSRSGYSSLNQSHASFGEESSLGHSTPRVPLPSALPHRANSCQSSRSQSKTRIHRTLSLPESDLANINADDLQERFSRLQIEQENRELKMLVRQLQDALEKLEEKVIKDLSKSSDSCSPASKANTSNCNNNILKTTLNISNSSTLLQSPDSLEDNNINHDIGKVFKIKDKNESGYSTFNNETLNDEHLPKNGSMKDYQYMEYSDSFSYGSTSEEERQFYESRLSKKRNVNSQYNDSACCMMQ